MTVVEHDLFNEGKDDELKDDPVKRRQFPAKATSTPLHHNERQIHERNADQCLVHDHHQHNVSQLSTIHLCQHQHYLLAASKQYAICVSSTNVASTFYLPDISYYTVSQ